MGIYTTANIGFYISQNSFTRQGGFLLGFFRWTSGSSVPIVQHGHGGGNPLLFLFGKQPYRSWPLVAPSRNKSDFLVGHALFERCDNYFILLQGLLEQKGFYLRQFRRFLLMGAFGSGLYFALTQVILSISGTGLTEHAGLNTMGSFDLAASLRKLLWLYFDREHPYMNLLVYPTSLIWQLIGWLGLAAFGLTMD